MTETRLGSATPSGLPRSAGYVHGAAEGFTARDVLAAVEQGILIEHFPDRGRCPCCARVRLGSGRLTWLHVVCDYNHPVRVGIVTVYVPSPAGWQHPVRGGTQMSGDLLDNVLGFGNLMLARDRVKQNRGVPGADGVSLKRFERSAQSHLLRLADDVRTGQYRVGPLRRITIHDPPTSRGG